VYTAIPNPSHRSWPGTSTGAFQGGLVFSLLETSGNVITVQASSTPICTKTRTTMNNGKRLDATGCDPIYSQDML
jgi:hypothetical protein